MTGLVVDNCKLVQCRKKSKAESEGFISTHHIELSEIAPSFKELVNLTSLYTALDIPSDLFDDVYVCGVCVGMCVCGYVCLSVCIACLFGFIASALFEFVYPPPSSPQHPLSPS